MFSEVNMNERQTQQCKRSIVKVVGSCITYNAEQPYLQDREFEAGGTGFFVDPKVFGSKFKSKKTFRYLLTNFHVVETFRTGRCQIEWPERGLSYLTATVEFVVPNIDVAILSIDPSAIHPQWWLNDAAEYLESVPNLTLDTTNMQRSNSQTVTAVGFPNLSEEYQVSQGVLSGRGCGMLQLDITFNDGNSGGPLFLKTKVIGICTASLTDNERSGLAIPIQMMHAFFSRWTDYSSRVLQTPSWGMITKVLTNDYLDFKKIDRAYEGALVKKVLHDKLLRPGDIIMGITHGTTRLNVNKFCKVKTYYTDTLVSMDDLEFILHLSGEIKLDIYRKKRSISVNLRPFSQDFKVRTVYPKYEHVKYILFGGCCITDFNMNLVEDEDEESAASLTSLLKHVRDTDCLSFMSVVTHISAQSHIIASDGLKVYDEIVRINKKKVKGLVHLGTLLDKISENFHAGRAEFIEIETRTDTHVYSLKSLQRQEISDSLKEEIPTTKLRLLPQKKRKYACV